MSYVEPLWEVFVRADRGLSHVHVGSLHAPDPELAVADPLAAGASDMTALLVWCTSAQRNRARAVPPKDRRADPVPRLHRRRLGTIRSRGQKRRA